VNPRDEEALLRIINYPARGIGKTTMEKIVAAAGSYDKSLWDIITGPSEYQLQINAGTRRKLIDFVTIIRSFLALQEKKDAYDLARHIASSSGILKDLYEDKSPEGLSRYENIEELLNAIKEFVEQETSFNEETGERETRRLRDFLQEIALITDADEKDKQDGDFISLMTVHAAKGLEFPYIYVVGLEENLFPSIQSLNNRADLEEERRLFYVAVTRAERQLTLSYAEHRYRWGDLTFCEPSRFLDEIDHKFLELPHKVSIPGSDKGRTGFQSTEESQLLKKKNLKKIDPVKEAADAERAGFSKVSDIQPGMIVEHQKFGTGKVIHVEGFGGSQKATVFFQGVGQKNLLLKFARLKIVDQ
jgi:DNA helicase-2/ATP-dependent DNA helicase PcrA